jgi:hypothetical protein
MVKGLDPTVAFLAGVSVGQIISLLLVTGSIKVGEVMYTTLVLTPFILGKVTRFTLHYLETFPASRGWRVKREAFMDTKITKLEDVSGAKDYLEEANANRSLEDRMGKILDYAILSAVDWDEEEARKLTQSLNRHIWRNLIHCHPSISVLWSSKKIE